MAAEEATCLAVVLLLHLVLQVLLLRSRLHLHQSRRHLLHLQVQGKLVASSVV